MQLSHCTTSSNHICISKRFRTAIYASKTFSRPVCHSPTGIHESNIQSDVSISSTFNNNGSSSNTHFSSNIKTHLKGSNIILLHPDLRLSPSDPLSSSLYQHINNKSSAPHRSHISYHQYHNHHHTLPSSTDNKDSPFPDASRISTNSMASAKNYKGMNYGNDSSNKKVCGAPSNAWILDGVRHFVRKQICKRGVGDGICSSSHEDGIQVVRVKKCGSTPTNPEFHFYPIDPESDPTTRLWGELLETIGDESVDGIIYFRQIPSPDSFCLLQTRKERVNRSRSNFKDCESKNTCCEPSFRTSIQSCSSPSSSLSPNATTCLSSTTSTPPSLLSLRETIGRGDGEFAECNCSRGCNSGGGVCDGCKGEKNGKKCRNSVRNRADGGGGGGGSSFRKGKSKEGGGKEETLGRGNCDGRGGCSDKGHQSCKCDQNNHRYHAPPSSSSPSVSSLSDTFPAAKKPSLIQTHSLGSAEEGDDNVKYYGLVVQGTEPSTADGCYVLKTSQLSGGGGRFSSGSESSSTSSSRVVKDQGCKCVLYSLTQMCSGQTLYGQLQNCWLTQ